MLRAWGDSLHPGRRGRCGDPGRGPCTAPRPGLLVCVQLGPLVQGAPLSCQLKPPQTASTLGAPVGAQVGTLEGDPARPPRPGLTGVCSSLGPLVQGSSPILVS
ncbi:unnamed protein product [Arctogadus glacialis]